MFYGPCFTARYTGTSSPSSSCNLVVDEYTHPFEVFRFEISPLLTEHASQMFKRDVWNFVRPHWGLDLD